MSSISGCNTVEANNFQSNAGGGQSHMAELPPELLDRIFRCVLFGRPEPSPHASPIFLSQALDSLGNIKKVCHQWGSLAGHRSILVAMARAMDFKIDESKEDSDLLKEIGESCSERLMEYRMVLEKFPIFEAALVGKDTSEFIIGLLRSPERQKLLGNIVGNYLDLMFGAGGFVADGVDLDISDIRMLFDLMNSETKQAVFQRKPSGLDYESTWLIEAVKGRDEQALDWVMLLLQNGADLNEQVGDAGCTLLCTLADEPENTEMITLLRQMGAGEFGEHGLGCNPLAAGEALWV